MGKNPDNKKVGGEFEPLGIVLESAAISAIVYGLILLTNEFTKYHIDFIAQDVLVVGNFFGNLIYRIGKSLVNIARSRKPPKK